MARVLREGHPEIAIPASGVFWTWHLHDENLQSDLARARLNGVEAHMEDIVDIADTANGDAYIDTRADGTSVARIDGEAIARSKLKIDARIKRAQMIAPRKYGPKIDMTSDGKQLGDNGSEATRIAKAAALMRQVKQITIDNPKVASRLQDMLD